MKTKKLTLFALSLVIVVAIAGCTTPNEDSGFNNRLGTQTRIGNNGLGTGNNMSGGTGLNNGMNDMNGMNNGLNGGLNNDGLNNTMGGNASELARRIGALPEVESAAVAISGNRAVVGLNLNGNGNNGRNNGGTNTGGMNNTGLTGGMNNRTNTGMNNTGTGLTGGLNNRTNTGMNNTGLTGGLNNGINNGNMNNENNISSSLRQEIETMVRETNRNITSVSITSDPNLFSRIQNMSNGTNRTNGTNGTNNGGLLNTIGNDFEQLIRDITPNSNINR